MDNIKIKGSLTSEDLELAKRCVHDINEVLNKHELNPIYVEMILDGFLQEIRASIVEQLQELTSIDTNGRPN